MPIDTSLLEDPTTFSLILTGKYADKIESLQAFARHNNIKVSDGLIMRALLLYSEPGPEFLGMLKKQKAEERQQRAERRRDSLAASKARKTAKKS